MPVEAATFVADLSPTNPTGSEQVAQGDDHLRLIKDVLQNTFPDADRPHYKRRFESVTSAHSVVEADDRKYISADASGGSFNITLPTLGVDDDGWEVTILRTDTDMTKRLGVVPAAGTIDGKTSIGIWLRLVPIRFIWSGTAWICIGRPKPGMIETYSGTTAPPGYVFAYGQELSRTTYKELFDDIGVTHGAGDTTTTFNVPDHRGRVTAGQDDMGGVSADRLTGLSGGVNGDTMGAVGGSQSHVLTEAQLAAHDHGRGSLVTDTVVNHKHTLTMQSSAQFAAGGAAALVAAGSTDTSNAGAHDHAISGTTASAGSGSAHNNVQPTIIENIVISLG